MQNCPKTLTTLDDVRAAAEASDLNQTRDDSWLAIGPLSWDGHPIRPDWVERHDADEILAERLAVFAVFADALAAEGEEITVDEAKRMFHYCMNKP